MRLLFCSLYRGFMYTCSEIRRELSLVGLFPANLELLSILPDVMETLWDEAGEWTLEEVVELCEFELFATENYLNKMRKGLEGH